MGGAYRYIDSRHVDIDPTVAWEIVSNHERMSEWTPAHRVVLEVSGTPDRNGVGAVRALHMLGPTIRERVTAFDPPEALRYVLVSGLPFRNYSGEITVEPSSGGSRITTAISFRTIVPGTQILVAIAIRLAGRGVVRTARRRGN